MRCHGTGRPSSAILPRASWTQFSPSAGTPASMARRIRSTSTVFETPISSTSSGAPCALGRPRDPLAHTLEVGRNVEHARF